MLFIIFIITFEMFQIETNNLMNLSLFFFSMLCKNSRIGFGFITFELEESANQVLQEHYIQFNGKQVQI